jgi:hypothetical protein
MAAGLHLLNDLAINAGDIDKAGKVNGETFADLETHDANSFK